MQSHKKADPNVLNASTRNDDNNRRTTAVATTTLDPNPLAATNVAATSEAKAAAAPLALSPPGCVSTNAVSGIAVTRTAVGGCSSCLLSEGGALRSRRRIRRRGECVFEGAAARCAAMDCSRDGGQREGLAVGGATAATATATAIAAAAATTALPSTAASTPATPAPAASTPATPALSSPAAPTPAGEAGTTKAPKTTTTSKPNRRQPRGNRPLCSSPSGATSSRNCCRLFGGALLLWGTGGPTSTTTLVAAAAASSSSAAASVQQRRTAFSMHHRRRSGAIALLQAGSAGRGLGVEPRRVFGAGPANSAAAADATRRPTTQLWGYSIKVRDGSGGGGKRDWEESGGRRGDTRKGFGKSSTSNKSKLDGKPSAPLFSGEQETPPANQSTPPSSSSSSSSGNKQQWLPESSSAAVGSVGRNFLEIFSRGSRRRRKSQGSEREDGEKAAAAAKVSPSNPGTTSAAAVDPADPLRGDLPLAREQRLKMAVAETVVVGATPVAGDKRENSRGGRRTTVAPNAFAAAAPVPGKPGPDDKSSSSGSRSNSSRNNSNSNSSSSNSNSNSRSSGSNSARTSGGGGGGDGNENKRTGGESAARMRRYLPGAKSTGKKKPPTTSTTTTSGGGGTNGSGGTTAKREGGSEATSASHTAARSKKPAASSPNKKAVAAVDAAEGGETIASGGGAPGGDPDHDARAQQEQQEQQRRRKCPPAVGFVGGFRDIALGTPASTAGGMPTTDALIKALSEPLKPSRSKQLALAPWQEGGGAPGGYADESTLAMVGGSSSAGGRWTRMDTGSSSSSRRKPGVPQNHQQQQQQQQQRSPPGRDFSATTAAAGVALDDRSKELDPPSRNVTITFNPDAPSLLGCITANTDAYGPALCVDTAGRLSREETAAYLERWVLIAVKHGVLPRELRALLQDSGGGRDGNSSGGRHHPQDGNSVRGRRDSAVDLTPDYFYRGHGTRSRGEKSRAATAGIHEGEGESRGGSAAGRENNGGGGGGGGREGGQGSASGSSSIGRDGGREGSKSASSSWTKYGWNRFDGPPSAPASAARGGEGSSAGVGSPRVGRRSGGAARRLSFDDDDDDDDEDDEEAAEEERMENLAEALVGGERGGSQDDAENGGDADVDDAGTVGGQQRRRQRHRRVSYPQFPENPGFLPFSLPPAAALGTAPPYQYPDGAAAVGKGSRPKGRRGGSSADEIPDRNNKKSLGWRVLEVVEARFKSGLHPPRIIAIGDVHGCVNELKDLVRKVEYWPGDLLLFLGDLVAKGPNSAGVVRTARELGGVSVRGNHEFEVLRWLNVGENESGRGPTAHHQIAMSLSEDDGIWLKNSPWYFQCEDLDALFVHAGFTPGVTMKRQNPRMMMNMRSLTVEGGAPTSRVVENRPWAREWAGPDTVFFGHDAARGLQVLDQAMGLDTGCVYGGRLTACILPERRLVSVASKAAYMQYRKKRRRSSTSGSTGGSPREGGSGRSVGGWRGERGSRRAGSNGSSSRRNSRGRDGKGNGRHRSPYDKLSPG